MLYGFTKTYDSLKLKCCSNICGCCFKLTACAYVVDVYFDYLRATQIF